MSAITPEEIAALRKLAEAATPGPWTSTPESEAHDACVWKADGSWLANVGNWARLHVIAGYDTDDHDPRNVELVEVEHHNTAEYIAAANPQTILALLAELEAARRERAVEEDRRGRPYDRVIEDIKSERELQDAQWGGPEHDDKHTVGEWYSYIYRQLSLAAPARERLVKVAALAVAAIESLDRWAERRAHDKPEGSPRAEPSPALPTTAPPALSVAHDKPEAEAALSAGMASGQAAAAPPALSAQRQRAEELLRVCCLWSRNEAIDAMLAYGAEREAAAYKKARAVVDATLAEVRQP